MSPANNYPSSACRQRARFPPAFRRQIQQRLPEQPFVSARVFRMSPSHRVFTCGRALSHFRNHPARPLFVGPLLSSGISSGPRILQELRHHVRDVPRLLQDAFGVVQSPLPRKTPTGSFARKPEIVANAFLKLVRDSRGQLAQRRQIFPSVASVAVARQAPSNPSTGRSPPLIFPSPRRIGEIVTPRRRVSPAGRDMLHHFRAGKILPGRKALRNQLGHLRRCSQGLAVAPESQSANSQHLPPPPDSKWR